jgi:hypothetical protein
MANDKDKIPMKWTSADEALLIEALVKEKLKGNCGDNNLKPVAYTACEVVLAGSEKVSGGSRKGVQANGNEYVLPLTSIRQC